MENLPLKNLHALLAEFEHAVRMHAVAGPAFQKPDYTSNVQKTRNALIDAWLENQRTDVPKASESAEPMAFLYVNYLGKREWREVEPRSWRYGTSPYHDKHDWLLTAFDPSRNEFREFALGGIIAVQQGNALISLKTLDEPEKKP